MWTVAQVNQVKRGVKQELDRVEEGQGRAARLAAAMSALQLLADDDRSESRLRSLVLLMSCLVHYQRYGGLTQNQWQSYDYKVASILQAQGIEPGRSSLAFLWGELHQVRSLIERRQGQQWLAAWEQQLSGFLARPTAFHRDPSQNLARGNRALRLANTEAAIAEFSVAFAEGGIRVREQAGLGLVRCLRLQGEHVAARQQWLQLQSLAEEGSAAFVRELRWERLRIDQTESGDWRPLVAGVGRRGEYCLATYIVEAFLLLAAMPSRDGMRRLRKMSTVQRDRHVDSQRRRDEIKLARVIEDSYDTDVPMVLRLRTLGQQLGHLGHLDNVEKELLAWAAAARWLVRAHSKPLARLALQEYFQLSLRLSCGRNADVAGVAGDLYEKCELPLFGHDEVGQGRVG